MRCATHTTSGVPHLIAGTLANELAVATQLTSSNSLSESSCVLCAELLVVQIVVLPAAFANYLVTEFYLFLGLSGNFFPILFAAITIILALRALMVVSTYDPPIPACTKLCFSLHQIRATIVCKLTAASLLPFC